MNVVGSVMSEHAKVSTLEKVNVHLLKKDNEQKEQQVTQLLDSVAPVQEGNKGLNIDIQV